MERPDVDETVVRRYWAGDDGGQAFLAIDRVMRDGGPEAVRVIEMLAGSAPDEQSLNNLGAGFLEDLVKWHGVALAGELDAAIEREPRLRVAVSAVRVGFEQLEPDTSFVKFFFLS